jgi:hypothetical protein
VAPRGLARSWQHIPLMGQLWCKALTASRPAASPPLALYALPPSRPLPLLAYLLAACPCRDGAWPHCTVPLSIVPRPCPSLARWGLGVCFRKVVHHKKIHTKQVVKDRSSSFSPLSSVGGFLKQLKSIWVRARGLSSPALFVPQVSVPLNQMRRSTARLSLHPDSLTA